MVNYNTAYKLLKKEKWIKYYVKEKEMLEKVTQHVSAGLALISKDHHILWANHVLKDLFGEIEGKNVTARTNS